MSTTPRPLPSTSNNDHINPDFMSSFQDLMGIDDVLARPFYIKMKDGPPQRVLGRFDSRRSLCSRHSSSVLRSFESISTLSASSTCIFVSECKASFTKEMKLPTRDEPALGSFFTAQTVEEEPLQYCIEAKAERRTKTSKELPPRFPDRSPTEHKLLLRDEPSVSSFYADGSTEEAPSRRPQRADTELGLPARDEPRIASFFAEESIDEAPLRCPQRVDTCETELGFLTLDEATVGGSFPEEAIDEAPPRCPQRTDTDTELGLLIREEATIGSSFPEESTDEAPPRCPQRADTDLGLLTRDEVNIGSCFPEEAIDKAPPRCPQRADTELGLPTRNESGLGRFFSAAKAPPIRPNRQASMSESGHSSLLDCTKCITPFSVSSPTSSVKHPLYEVAEFSSHPVSLLGDGRGIEIAPGVHVPLRGAEETWKCIEDNNFLSTSCFVCAMEICCIRDASYVLCPECRMVSPLEENQESKGGVGLGFGIDDLFRWQAGIRQRQHVASTRI